MNIYVNFDIHQRSSEEIVYAIDLLNGIQNYFKFLASDTPLNIKGGYFVWNTLPDNIRNDTQSYHIYIIEEPFNDNWFSHEESHYSVITTADWNEHFAPPSLAAYLIYQIAQAVVNFEFKLNENQVLRQVHETTVGCMFDFCGLKTEIRNGMRVGAICPNCRGILAQFGNHQDALSAIEKILDHVRLISIGRSPQINYNQVYIIKHYDEPSDIHNAFTYGVEPALIKLGFNANIGNRQNHGAHYFYDIIKDITCCKLALVLIDHSNNLNNLNSYLEYGIAVGMGKDVFIICEEEFIPQLPSDLHGIQVISFKAKDYAGLNHNIENTLRDYSIPLYVEAGSK